MAASRFRGNADRRERPRRYSCVIAISRSGFSARPAGGRRRATASISRLPRARCWRIPRGSLTRCNRCAPRGAQISIDDFGTGYSSLSRLSTLPVDALKIDRSFVSALVAEESSQAVVSTIVALARAFKLSTVAEGGGRRRSNWRSCGRWVASIRRAICMAGRCRVGQFDELLGLALQTPL